MAGSYRFPSAMFKVSRGSPSRRSSRWLAVAVKRSSLRSAAHERGGGLHEDHHAIDTEEHVRLQPGADGLEFPGFGGVSERSADESRGVHGHHERACRARRAAARTLESRHRYLEDRVHLRGKLYAATRSLGDNVLIDGGWNNAPVFDPHRPDLDGHVPDHDSDGRRPPAALRRTSA